MGGLGDGTSRTKSRSKGAAPGSRDPGGVKELGEARALARSRLRWNWESVTRVVWSSIETRVSGGRREQGRPREGRKGGRIASLCIPQIKEIDRIALIDQLKIETYYK
ncbi:hypothetical protein L6452_16410 [Arctium lappa]|uniref:Uncharacterized protein n=1 Tax=Arctium lappa TaxID=4217 RepID=A0ACB9C0N9_ARCLA|nr:hypothetical protein L6452_16410 [Arctium lappa]